MLYPVPHRYLRALFVFGWLMLMLLLAVPTSAAPVAIRTTPLDGEILQRTPTAVGIGFEGPLDTEQSTFGLLNRDGSEVEGISLTYGNDNSSVTLNLPREFPEDVYTIVWHAVSAADGESTDGWSSFSVGNSEDANIITIPTSASGHEGPPTWMRAGAGWIALVGIAISMSIWPIWQGIIRPVLAKVRAASVATTRRLQQLAWIALAIAIFGSLSELIAESLATRDTDVIDAVMQTLGQDDWGFWWMMRMLLLVLLGIGLALSPWWYPKRSPFKNGFLWCISLLLPLPLILSGHANDDAVGRITTVAMGYLHLLALFLVLGGAFIVALSVLDIVKEGDVRTGRILHRRFTWVILSAGITTVLTGFYLATVFAGNRDAITQTFFGEFLMAQIVIGIIATVISILLIIRPITLPTSMRLSAVLAVVLTLSLLPTAGMEVVPPARAELAERSVQTRQSLDFDGRPGIWLIAPGRAGVNHLRLETPGTYLQTETEVFVDISSPDHPSIGTKTIQMYRVQGNAFEHHGTEFSLIGSWQFNVRIEEPGFPSSVSPFTQVIGEENESVQVPPAPWKFDTLAGLAGISLALTGVLGLSLAVVLGKGPLRKEAGGLASVAIALAIVVIVQGRIDPVLVVESGEGAINPNDLVMVARGEETFATHCSSCHGVGLRGDGPLSEALNPPPSDFAAPHTRVHDNEDYIYWIQYGIQGTAMSGFRSQLTDQDIRDVLAYIQHWQQTDEEKIDATPELGVCEVSPLAFSDIPTLLQHGIHPETRRGTPLVRSADSTVSPERTNEIMWTVEQTVNCANQDEFLSQLRLFSQPMLQEIFPQGASYELTSRATSPSEPVDPADAITIQDVQSLVYLADGRVAVTVIFNDPAGIGVIPGVAPVYQVTLILVLEDDVWLIDEVR